MRHHVITAKSTDPTSAYYAELDRIRQDNPAVYHKLTGRPTLAQLRAIPAAQINLFDTQVAA